MRASALRARRRARRRRRRAAVPDAGGRRGRRAAALAGRRPLHLPRLPRVRAGRRTTATATALRAVPGTGLGILRARPAARRVTLGRAAAARSAARARERTLLVLTKANSRSTVHRPAYLDYIGVKTFDDAGEVVGERRFLGLFTSAAYTASVRGCRCCAARCARCWTGPGSARAATPARTCCRSWRPTRATSCSRSRPTSCYRPSLGVLHLQERRQLRLFLRRDAYGRFMSCLVYLPRDRYTTAVRLRDAGDPAARLQRLERRLHRPGHRVGAGPAALRRAGRPGRAPAATSTPTRSRRELVEATRSWDDDFADALRRSCGEEQARRAARGATATPSPRPTRRTSRPRDGGRRPATGWSCCDEPTATSTLQPLRSRRDAAPGERRLQGLPRRRADLAVAGAAGAAHAGRRGRRRAAVRDRARRRPRVWIYDFGLRYDRRAERACPRRRPGRWFQDAFAAVWRGEAESRRLQRAGAARPG